MPYQPYTTKAMELESRGWVELKSFRKLMRSLSYRPIFDSQNRSFAQCEIIRLQELVEPPFNSDTRFPETLYVNVDHPFVSSRLKTMLDAINSQSKRDQKKDVNTKFYKTRPIQEYHDTVIELRDSLSDDSTCIYSRSRLEELAGLKWTVLQNDTSLYTPN